jgi:hypothetical protein
MPYALQWTSPLPVLKDIAAADAVSIDVAMQYLHG